MRRHNKACRKKPKRDERSEYDPYASLPALYPSHPQFSHFRDFTEFLEIRDSDIIPKTHRTQLRRGTYVSTIVPGGKIPHGAVAALYRGDRISNEEWVNYDRKLQQQSRQLGGEKNVYCINAVDEVTKQVLYVVDGRGERLVDPNNPWRYKHLDVTCDPHNVSKFINSSSNKELINIMFAYNSGTDTIEAVALRDLFPREELVCDYGEATEDIIDNGSTSSDEEGDELYSCDESTIDIPSAPCASLVSTTLALTLTHGTDDPVKETRFKVITSISPSAACAASSSVSASAATPVSACEAKSATASDFTSPSQFDLQFDSRLDVELTMLVKQLESGSPLTKAQKVQFLFKHRILMAIATSDDSRDIDWNQACLEPLRRLEYMQNKMKLPVSDVFDVFRCLALVPRMVETAIKSCKIPGIGEYVRDNYRPLLDDIVVADSNDLATNRSLRLHDYFITMIIDVMETHYCRDVVGQNWALWTYLTHADKHTHDENSEDPPHFLSNLPQVDTRTTIRRIRYGGFELYNFDRIRVEAYFYELLEKHGCDLVNQIITMCTQKWPALCPLQPIHLLLHCVDNGVGSFIWSYVICHPSDQRYVLQILKEEQRFLKVKHKRLRDNIDTIDLTQDGNIRSDQAKKKPKHHECVAAAAASRSRC